jgi:FtsP/CotA-like multicopper oxidase with cupredoxin domain
MYFNCSAKTVDASCTPNAGISKFSFKTGKTHRLRLINSGSDGMQKFSIDDHTLTVIAVDLVPVVPYNTTVVTLGVGQRTDVLVKATGKPGEAYWMRSNFSQLCAAPPSLQPYALAAIYYPGANQNARPTSMAYSYTQTDCLNVSTTYFYSHFVLEQDHEQAF